MATGADVRDILELAGGENDGPISKKDLINSDKVRHKCDIIFLNMYCNCASSYTEVVTKRKQSHQGHSNKLRGLLLLFLLLF